MSERRRVTNSQLTVADGTLLISPLIAKAAPTCAFTGDNFFDGLTQGQWFFNEEAGRSEGPDSRLLPSRENATLQTGAVWHLKVGKVSAIVGRICVQS